MYHESPTLWKHLLERGLEEDGWAFDWTTLGTLKAGRSQIRAKVVAKSDGVFAGSGAIAAVRALSRELEDPIDSRGAIEDGARFKKGQVIGSWSGSPRAVLALERPFLNLISYASGIATRTAGLVDRVASRWKVAGGPGFAEPRVVSTRKILPHYRDLAILAVQAGGGHAHRVNLAGGVLIKENHIASAGGIAQAIDGVRAVAPHLLKIEIEVRDAKEFEEALLAGAEVIMLDNFPPAQVSGVLKRFETASGKPIIEISGGITEANIADYVIPGVDIISVGSLTHSVESADFSLLVD